MTYSSSKSETYHDIIQHIKQNYQEKAENLLKLLSQHPGDFSFDNNGVVKMFGETYLGIVKIG